MQSRKRNRLEGYDYSQQGAYFITVCAEERKHLFGRIATHVGASVPARQPHVELSIIGKHIDDAIKFYNANATDFVFDRYIIMPNHLHAIIIIREATGERGRSPLRNIVRNLKGYVTKQAGYPVWQKSFHDHIIRNEADYVRISEYIESNPAVWENDRYYINA